MPETGFKQTRKPGLTVASEACLSTLNDPLKTQCRLKDTKNYVQV